MASKIYTRMKELENKDSITLEEEEEYFRLTLEYYEGTPPPMEVPKLKKQQAIWRRANMNELYGEEQINMNKAAEGDGIAEDKDGDLCIESTGVDVSLQDVTEGYPKIDLLREKIDEYALEYFGRVGVAPVALEHLLIYIQDKGWSTLTKEDLETYLDKKALNDGFGLRKVKHYGIKGMYIRYEI